MKLQQGKIVNIVQGSEQWAELRAKRFTASEAAAALGKHKYMSRNDLLKQKATGIVPEVSDHQQRIYDDGHRAEAAARPIVEKIIGDDLYPVVLDDEEGGFLASMDGLNMMGEIGFEHKWLSADLAEQIEAGKLDEHYLIQMDQQFALSGADRIIFVGSDGTEENLKYLWIERDESRFKAVEAGWEQFDKDLAEYEAPEVEQPKAEGKAPDALPALSVQVQGMVIASNLKAFEESARATLAKINTNLQTDEDFVSAEKAVKFCKEVETRLTATKEQIIGQMQSVDEAVRTVDALFEEFRQKRLGLDKSVKTQKEQRKQEILSEYRQAFSLYPTKALADVVKYMPAINADFAGAMKGLKTMASIRSACDDELARAKIEANEIASIIRVNLQQKHEHAHGYDFLFNDFGQICEKPAEDFAAIVKSRIADHREVEQKRLDEQREQIREEEEAKAQADQEAKTRPVERPMPSQEHEDELDRHLESSGYVSMGKQASATPMPNEIVKVIADHYGVSFQKAASWLASVEWKVAA